MEEKLYFKPESSRKKVKKDRKTQAKNNHRILKLAVFLIFIAIAIIVILWLLRGKTKSTGQFPENVKNESLTCISKTSIPPKINSIDSDDKEIKINAIFNSNDLLRNISFIYTLVYKNEDEAYGAEAKSHAFLNHALNGSGYSVSKFDNKFARYDNKLIISLHANEKDIDTTSAPFFMIKTEDYEVKLKTLEDYKNNYESQGFTCQTSKE